MEEEVSRYWYNFQHVLTDYIPKIVGAIIILVLGLWVINLLVRLTKRIMIKRDVDKSVSDFLKSLIKWGLTILLVIIVISKLGVPTTSFIAVLGAAGLAIGMALQGSLGNFAGGILILLFKPYRIGDYISAQDISGTVIEISIFTTSLRTDGNQLAIIPNGQLSNEKIINYSVLDKRTEVMEFPIHYLDDTDVAREIIFNIINDHPKVIKDETTKPRVVIGKITENRVYLQAIYQAKTSEFWGVHFEVLDRIKKALDKAGINKMIPRQEIKIVENQNDS